MYQKYQGDVSFIKIDKLPTSIKLKQLPKNGYVVAEGETTFHKHLLVADKTSEVLYGTDENNNLYMEIKSGTATITHEEHKEITFEQGIYFIGKQVEYDELGDRQVKD